MPRQNRVTPFNELIATPARGTLMGNRGVLHDASGSILRPHAHRTWVTCLLAFKGRHRDVMTPGRYTELFFLDEATALAAGHRPCGECRHGDHLRFKALWKQVRGEVADGRDGNLKGGVLKAGDSKAGDWKAGDIDRILHGERVAGRGRQSFKPLHLARFASLPDGAMFFLREQEATKSAGMLKWGGGALEWTPEGYREAPAPRPELTVTVLTPPTVVEVIRAGYRPMAHPSAAFSSEVLSPAVLSTFDG